MSKTRNKLARLFAVVAVVGAILVPAAVAGAGAMTVDNCDGIIYNPANPNHFVYPDAGQSIAGGKMIVDRSDAPAGEVVFWNGNYSVGTDGAVITGSKFGDRICGTDGDDWINGRKGDDRIVGNGSDTSYNSATGLGGDQLYGKAGNDNIITGDPGGPVTMTGALINGGSGNDTLTSTRTDNAACSSLASAPHGDDIFGKKGNDTLVAGNSDGNLLVGSSGDDHLSGGDDCNTYFGKGGVDTILVGSASTVGGADDNIANGGAGIDTIAGPVTVAPNGTSDDNTLSGHKGNDTINAGNGHNIVVLGGPGNDTLLMGGAGTNDQFALGGSDNDVISPRTGVAPAAAENGFFADGELGNDTITGSAFFDDTANTTGFGGAFGLNGGAGNDAITGGAGDDLISGDAGNDTLLGGTGADMINGGSGLDWIEGGAGADTMLGGSDGDTLFGNRPLEAGSDFDVADGSADDMDGQDGPDEIHGNCADPTGVNDGGSGEDIGHQLEELASSSIEVHVNSCDA